MRKYRHTALALVAMLALVAGNNVWSTHTQDVSGVGHLANGNVWVVTQNGDQLSIEETHHDSREVSRKGAAALRGKVLDLELDVVFERGYHYTGELLLGANAATMTGRIILQRDGREEPMTLTRQPHK